jgi:F420-dependent oxidoreductase-like protein
MKIGIQIPRFTWPGGDTVIAAKLAEIARTADNVGFSSVWVMDHFFQLPGLGQADEPMLEGYSALTYLAAVTKNVTLGTLVTGVIYREPAFLIKQVTNLDVLSGGRAYFGVGAAWYEREAKGLGFPFPPVKTRFERLEEALQIAHHMWSGNRAPYHGKHYQLEEPICSPMPIHHPHPPIMIGGMGETKTLRFVAKYANACNLFARMGLDVVQHKLDVLKRHCDKLGRDYAEIEKTTLGTVHLSPDQMSTVDVIEQCRALAGLGVTHTIFNMPNVHEIAPLEMFGKEIIPAVAEL